MSLEPLTPREEEVLGWVALGKRNDEIGEILTLSPRTVEKHVANVMRKLQAETRSAAGAWWHDRRHSADLARLADGRRSATERSRAAARRVK